MAAVRALRPELLRDRQLRARLRHTVRVAARIEHPYVARYLDCELDSEVPWLATEFVSGPALVRLVERYGPLPERAVRALGGALSEALTALDAAGVAHGGLDSGNVLLTADQPRMVDPGLRSTTGADGAVEGIAGDVFDLGVLLAFAATAHPPFRDATVAGVPGEPHLTGVPDSLQPVLLSCLHQAAERRPHPRPLAQALDPSRRSGQSAHSWLPEPYLLEIEAWQEAVRQHGGRRLFGRG